MRLEEVEIGQEVICSSLSEIIPFEQSIHREIGHIGTVIGVFPLKEVVLVGHIEMTEEGETGYVQFLTSFLVSELSSYEPEVTPLQRTIQKTLIQITRE